MEWKPIIGFEGRYEVSDAGLVRSVPRKVECNCRWNKQITKSLRGRILRSTTAGLGYRQVGLGAGNENKRYVHRLVAEAFVSRRPYQMHINHKNGDKNDNRVDNLEWVTPSENMRHSTHILGIRAGQFVSKLSAEEKASVRHARQSGEIQQAIADRFAVSRSTIRRCLSSP